MFILFCYCRRSIDIPWAVTPFSSAIKIRWIIEHALYIIFTLTLLFSTAKLLTVSLMNSRSPLSSCVEGIKVGRGCGKKSMSGCWVSWGEHNSRQYPEDLSVPGHDSRGDVDMVYYIYLMSRLVYCASTDFEPLKWSYTDRLSYLWHVVDIVIGATIKCSDIGTKFWGFLYVAFLVVWYCLECLVPDVGFCWCLARDYFKLLSALSNESVVVGGRMMALSTCSLPWPFNF